MYEMPINLDLHTFQYKPSILKYIVGKFISDEYIKMSTESTLFFTFKQYTGLIVLL